MKENKRSIITNIKIMLVALLIFIPLEFHMYSDYFAIWFYETFPINAIYLKDFIKVISSGIFTGAFVTCLVNRTAYNVAKVSTIEEFCSANYRFNNLLYKDIKVLEIGLPLNDVEQYYDDNNNDLFSIFVGDNEKKGEAEKRLKEYIWYNTDKSVQEMFQESADKEKYLDEKFAESIMEYDGQIKHIKTLYLNLADELTLKEIDYAFGNIDFMFGNKKYRKKLMYDAVLQEQKKIAFEILDFKRLFADGKPKLTKVALIERILKIQDLLFKEEKMKDLMNEDKINLADILEGDELEDALVEYVLVEEHKFNIDLILHRLLQYAYHNSKDIEKDAPVRHEYGIKYYFKRIKRRS